MKVALDRFLLLADPQQVLGFIELVDWLALAERQCAPLVLFDWLLRKGFEFELLLALKLSVLVVFLLKYFLGVNGAKFFLPHFLHHLYLTLVLKVELLPFLGSFQFKIAEFSQLIRESFL